jgi:hypothetical protein
MYSRPKTRLGLDAVLLATSLALMHISGCVSADGVLEEGPQGIPGGGDGSSPVVTAAGVTPGLTVSKDALAFTMRSSRGTLLIGQDGAGTLAYEITSDSDWAVATPSRGVTFEGQTQAVDVVVDGAGLDSGEHRGQLLVETSDGQRRLVQLSFTLEPASLEVEATALTLDADTRHQTSVRRPAQRRRRRAAVPSGCGRFVGHGIAGRR